MKLDRREFMGAAAAGLATTATATSDGDGDERRRAALGRTGSPGSARGFSRRGEGDVPEHSLHRSGADVGDEGRDRFRPGEGGKPNLARRHAGEGERGERKARGAVRRRPREIGFLFATSEGENLVTGALDLRPGDNVVVDDLHYTTSYVVYKTLERTKGIDLRIVPSVGGRADVSQFAPHVDARTRLVSVAWVSHQNGFRHDLKGLSKLAHDHGALLYADGIQALGMFPTNLHEEGVDFVTSGTYKWLYGSFGVAPFFIREEHLERIVPDRHGELSLEHEGPGYDFRLYSSARKYEYATLAFGPLYQLDAACDFLAKLGLARIEEHGVALAGAMRKGLVERGFAVRTPDGNRSAIVAFIHGKDPERARALFERNRVRVSFREEETQIRAGIGVFNAQDDVDRFLATADELRRL